ncbi:MAG: hypothetical protein ACRD3C_14720 [Vicinamibacterales bacterium]
MWSGTYKIEQCVRISGGGSSYCRFVLNGSLYIRLELVEQGQQISGEATLFNNLGTTVLERGNVTGQIEASGELTLSGTTTSVTSDPATTHLAGWRSELTAEGRLAGRFTKNRTFTNAFGPQVSREECRLEELSRQ